MFPHAQFTRSVIAALLLVPLAALADVVTDWNAKAEAIAVEKRLLPPPNARVMATLQVAMFEAVNAVEKRYAPYRLRLEAGSDVSSAAAAASAGHAVLAALHPDQAGNLDATLRAMLGAIADGAAKDAGIDLGRKAAAGVLALRAQDGSNAIESYRPHAAAGVYVPTVVPVSSTDGAVAPWVMDKASQFRPGPPPALNTATWTEDINEIRELGGRNSTRRSTEQTNVARFWFVTGPQAWNPLVRQLVAAKKLDLADSARLFALTAMAGADALTAVFDAKYTYNFWRPVTAIRNADLSGNPATPRDAGWLPLGDTPMHPEYPCAHCITASAVGSVLKLLVGNDIPEVTMTSPTAPGVVRRWTRVQDYVDEVSTSRIFAGFHYRNSTKVGEDMGRRIGELTVRTQLRAAAAAVQ